MKYSILIYESAADFADLRKVLGVTTWNVYGTSYGSYLAQTVMRDHPEGIRSIVLDSVLPTIYTMPANWRNTHAGFDNLFQACAAEPACNATHPNLEETFTGLVNKLEAEPLTTTVKDPATSEAIEVVIDGGAFVDWLRNQNYALPMLRAAPDRIGGLAAGQPAISATAVATNWLRLMPSARSSSVFMTRSPRVNSPQCRLAVPSKSATARHTSPFTARTCTRACSRLAEARMQSSFARASTQPRSRNSKTASRRDRQTAWRAMDRA